MYMYVYYFELILSPHSILNLYNDSLTFNLLNAAVHWAWLFSFLPWPWADCILPPGSPSAERQAPGSLLPFLLQTVQHGGAHYPVLTLKQQSMIKANFRCISNWRCTDIYSDQGTSWRHESICTYLLLMITLFFNGFLLCFSLEGGLDE